MTNRWNRIPVIQERLQLEVQMPPVVTIVPKVAPVTPGGLLNGAPGISAPFGHTRQSQRDRVIPLDEFGGLRMEIREVSIEITGNNGALQPLIYGIKKIRGAHDILQLFVRSLRDFSAGGAPPWENCAGDRAAVNTLALQRRAIRANEKFRQAPHNLEEL